MELVEYSDSEEEEKGEAVQTPPAKRRKVFASNGTTLPPLPSSFLDQYSSTVRTSTKDDPSLHGGRKRVTPHVEGNWPTHVFLEYIVATTQGAKGVETEGSTHHREVTSLLENDLNVAQPLHISLSRPLTLKTAQKDNFLTRLKDAVLEGTVRSLEVHVKDLAWHPNENKTRWFLVLSLQTSSQLNKLLHVCNGTAQQFNQPLLYDERANQQQAQTQDQFHISIAWSLQPPESQGDHETKLFNEQHVDNSSGIPYSFLSQLTSLSIHFNEVKVRIGQDVHSIALKARRQSST